MSKKLTDLPIEVQKIIEDDERCRGGDSEKTEAIESDIDLEIEKNFRQTFSGGKCTMIWFHLCPACNKGLYLGASERDFSPSFCAHCGEKMDKPKKAIDDGRT